VFKKLLKILAVMTIVVTNAAQSQTVYPDRPIKLVVAFPAGTVPDVMARMYAEKLKESLKQPIVIDNRPGASGAIGADLVAKSPGDGYTLLLNSSALIINPLLGKQPFDFFKDLTPIIRTAETPYMLVVNPKLPIQTLDDFIEYARKNPGKLSCATYGVGSPPHVVIEMLKKVAKIDIVPVPYNTAGSVVADLTSGQIDCSLVPPDTALQGFVSTGRMRVIANTGDTQMEVFPTAEPFGKKYPQATMVGWQAIFAPGSMPKPLVLKLHQEFVKVITHPEISQKVKDIGFTPKGDSLASFSTSIAADYERFSVIVRENNMKR